MKERLLKLDTWTHQQVAIVLLVPGEWARILGQILVASGMERTRPTLLLQVMHGRADRQHHCAAHMRWLL
jgi:hypothetical protein